jgi:hypothetical protein
MGQKSLKMNRRALRRVAKEEKNNIVSHYMTDNWDKVLVSSVSLIRSFKFKSRFSIAMSILFRPIKRREERVQAGRLDGGGKEAPGFFPETRESTARA